MGPWHNPQAVVIIQSAVDLVEVVVVVEVPPPAFAIGAFNIVSPIPMPVRAVALILRLEQNSEDTTVSKTMFLREKVCNGRPDRDQLAVLNQRILLQLVSVDRLQPLRLWIVLPGQCTCSDQCREP